MLKLPTGVGVLGLWLASGSFSAVMRWNPTIDALFVRRNVSASASLPCGLLQLATEFVALIVNGRNRCTTATCTRGRHDQQRPEKQRTKRPQSRQRKAGFDGTLHCLNSIQRPTRAARD